MQLQRCLSLEDNPLNNCDDSEHSCPAETTRRDSFQSLAGTSRWEHVMVFAIGGWFSFTLFLSCAVGGINVSGDWRYQGIQTGCCVHFWEQEAAHESCNGRADRWSHRYASKQTDFKILQTLQVYTQVYRCSGVQVLRFHWHSVMCRRFTDTRTRWAVIFQTTLWTVNPTYVQEIWQNKQQQQQHRKTKNNNNQK